MKRKLAYGLALAVLTSGMTACADESLPNRRGMERPALLSGPHSAENAEKRGNEAPARELPSGGGQEFPGQSRVPAARGVILLDDVATASPANSTVVAAPAADDMRSLPMHAVERHGDDHRAYAIPGRDMVAPNTGGEVISADWGEPVVMAEYPHRPYADTAVTYHSGTAVVNPTFVTTAYAHSYNSAETAREHGREDRREFNEIPWGLGSMVAFPVLVFTDWPWNATTVSWNDPSGLYHGVLPAGGEIIPAPPPGQLRFTYPTTQGSTYTTAPYTPMTTSEATIPERTAPMVAPSTTSAPAVDK